MSNEADTLDPKEYRHFCRMLAAVLDRATKAELLQFNLKQANALIETLRAELEKHEDHRNAQD